MRLAIAVAACFLPSLLSGCITLEKIVEGLETRDIKSSHLVPQLACDKAQEVFAFRTTASLKIATESKAISDFAGQGGTNKDAIETILRLDAGEGAAGRVLKDHLSAASPGAGKVSIPVSSEALRDDMRRMQETAQQGGYERLALLADKGGAAGALAARAAFFDAYFRGYLRDGELFTIKLDKAKAEARLRKDIANGLGIDYDKAPADQKKLFDDAVKLALSKICTNDGCEYVSAAQDRGFVNRAGQKFAFPIVTLAVTPGSGSGYELTKINEVALVGDLTRVFWEAAFDAQYPNVPANPNATGCVHDPKLLKRCAASPGDKALERINLVADRTEAISGAAAAQLVRGGWLLSLQNEALAQLLQTTISVSARKIAEAVAAANESCPGSPARAVPHRRIEIVVTR